VRMIKSKDQRDGAMIAVHGSSLEEAIASADMRINSVEIELKVAKIVDSRFLAKSKVAWYEDFMFSGLMISEGQGMLAQRKNCLC